MEKARFSILKAEIKEQLKKIDEVYQKIDQRKKQINQIIGLESLGYQLHSLYCAYEDLFKIIADFFENRAHCHKELLRRMKLDIEGIRPPVISEFTFRLLDELRAFRHFFRYAYFYELKEEKVKETLQVALELKKHFYKDIENFLSLINID